LTVLLVAAALRNDVLFEVFEKFIQSFVCGGEKNWLKFFEDEESGSSECASLIGN